MSKAEELMAFQLKAIGIEFVSEYRFHPIYASRYLEKALVRFISSLSVKGESLPLIKRNGSRI